MEPALATQRFQPLQSDIALDFDEYVNTSNDHDILANEASSDILNLMQERLPSFC